MLAEIQRNNIPTYVHSTHTAQRTFEDNNVANYILTYAPRSLIYSFRRILYYIYVTFKHIKSYISANVLSIQMQRGVLRSIYSAMFIFVLNRIEMIREV